MDSPYEHVHDDGELIQGSPGVANNFSCLTEAGKKEIASYEQHCATGDMSCRLRDTNRTLDPIEYLPPELSTFVITHALPTHDITSSPSMYPSRLIELTTVSKKWQSFLFSTPIIWSELVIDERQEDFLATLSVFVSLSSHSPLKLFLCGFSTSIDWAGLTSILFPCSERILSLTFGPSYNFEWVPIALSNLLERLCRLPRLEEVIFDASLAEWVSPFWIKSFGLPSTVNFNGVFRTELPESCWVSGTLGRFFDVTNCNTSGTLGRLVPPSQPNLLVVSLRQSHDTNIISNGVTLLQAERLAENLVGCNCFEQLVHTATFILHRLDVDVDLSQTEDLLDCLQMLMHLQVLDLRIRRGDRKITRDRTFSDTASRNLRRFDLEWVGGVENLVVAQKPLSDLFSALGILYPDVEEVNLRGRAWTGLETSYLQSLRALKSLALTFGGWPLALPSESLDLRSVQYLEMQGVARLDNLRTPNLLTLVLQLGSDVTNLDHLGLFPQRLQSLAITLEGDLKGFDLTSLDCPDLRRLYLNSWGRRGSWGHPQLLNLVSIEVGTPLQSFTDPSSNQLCITLLCYPWRLPSLRQLHFPKCVEWDVLFLMLKRRNCDESGVQWIDTVTLPFIPFAFQQLLTRLLAGEIVELSYLASLSLEATREVLFDPSVPGCFACMKNMRPGCTASLEHRSAMPVDIIYPTEDAVLEEAAQEIRDWLSQRWQLVEIWKASYEEFAKEQSRLDVCVEW